MRDVVADVKALARRADGDTLSKDSLVVIAAVQEVVRERETYRLIAKIKEAQAARRPPPKPPEEVRLSDRERAVLVDMRDQGAGEEYVVFFRGLTRKKEDIPEVRRVVRRLARKGLAFLVRGCMDEDGLLFGSGYGLTRAGIARADAERAK